VSNFNLNYVNLLGIQAEPIMLPIIWKIVLKNYLKVFFLCNLLFASMLVLVRVYEIARFATFGGGFLNLLLFTLLQFPFILPLAIPISCSIATTILVQKMCTSSELTSLRAFGFSIYSIYKPLFALSILFSALNFYLVFAVTPSIKQACKNLMIKVTTENPLAILKNGKISAIQNGYLNLALHSKSEKIKDLFFAFKNTATNQIALIFADELYSNNNQMYGKKIDYIYYESFDNSTPILILEHFQTLSQPCEILPL